MDRSRFQLDIGTMMIAVVVIAMMAAGAVRAGCVVTGGVAIVIGTRVITSRCVKARCRADGRAPKGVDLERIDAITYWIGIPAALAYCVAVVARSDFV